MREDFSLATDLRSRRLLFSEDSEAELSEHVLEEIDFGNLGYFLALTSNDQVNTLSVARFREIFGSDKIYQLPIAEATSSRMEPEWQNRMTRRYLFSPQLTYDFIDTALDRGAVVKVTPLTETFDFQAYRTHYGSRAWPLFVIDDRRLHILTTDSKLVPRPGQSIVSLILEEGPLDIAPGSSPNQSQRSP